MKFYKMYLILNVINLYHFSYSCYKETYSNDDNNELTEPQKLEIERINLLNNLTKTEKNTLTKIFPVDTFKKVKALYVSKKENIKNHIKGLKKSKQYIAYLLSKFLLKNLKIKLILKNTNEININEQFYIYFNEKILNMHISDSNIGTNIDEENIICFKYDKTDSKELHFCFFTQNILKKKIINNFLLPNFKKLNKELFLYFSEYDKNKKRENNNISNNYEISRELIKNEADNTYELYIIFKEK